MKHITIIAMLITSVFVLGSYAGESCCGKKKAEAAKCSAEKKCSKVCKCTDCKCTKDIKCADACKCG